MKKSNNVILILISFILIQCHLKANTGRDDTLVGLDLRGRIANVTENFESACKVELITSKGVVDSVILRDGKQKFRFFLQKTNYYALRLTKEGFVTKLISIHTEISNEFDDIFEFSFSTKLISKKLSEHLNKDALDFPTSIIHFDPQSETFIHNKEYTDRTRREVYSALQTSYNDDDFAMRSNDPSISHKKQ